MLPRLRVVLLALTLVTSAIAVVFVTGEIRRANRILSYDVDYTMSADGSMSVVEKIERRYVKPVRGVVFWGIDAVEVEMPVSDLKVRVDGKPESYVRLRHAGGGVGYGVVKDRLLVGRHRFELSYRAPIVVYSSGRGWMFEKRLLQDSLPIESARIRIRSTEPLSHVTCVVGRSRACSISGEGTRDLVITARDIPSGAMVLLQTPAPKAWHPR